MRRSFVLPRLQRAADSPQPILTGMNLIHCFMTDGKSVHAHSTDLWSFGAGGFYNLRLMWKQMDRHSPKVGLTQALSPPVANGVQMRPPLGVRSWPGGPDTVTTAALLFSCLSKSVKLSWGWGESVSQLLYVQSPVPCDCEGCYLALLRDVFQIRKALF